MTIRPPPAARRAVPVLMLRLSIAPHYHSAGPLRVAVGFCVQVRACTCKKETLGVGMLSYPSNANLVKRAQGSSSHGSTIASVWQTGTHLDGCAAKLASQRQSHRGGVAL